jgi:hypothetical protein
MRGESSGSRIAQQPLDRVAESFSARRRIFLAKLLRDKLAQKSDLSTVRMAGNRPRSAYLSRFPARDMPLMAG